MWTEDLHKKDSKLKFNKPASQKIEKQAISCGNNKVYW